MSLFDYDKKPVKDSKPMVWATINRRLTVIVPSYSRNGLMHEVEMTAKGWKCTCEDFNNRPEVYRKLEPCKHILRVKNAVLSGNLLNAEGVALTSRIAYKKIIDDGIWNKDCTEILKIVVACPDVCDKDIQRIWNAQLRKQNRPPKGINSVTGRRNDMMHMGFIYESGKKKSRKTNTLVKTWRGVFEN